MYQISIYESLRIYDKIKRFYLQVDRNKYLQDCVKGKLVLHVGCSDFPLTEQRIKEKNLLHLRLQEAASQIVGIDISDEGLKILNIYGVNNVKKMDAEQMAFEQSFDIILAGDVLEHLNNPGLFLGKSVSLLNPNGEIVIAVPSALTINNIKAWFYGWEQVHREHTFYFSPKTLSTLCTRFGLLPVKLIFTVQPEDTYEKKTFIIIRKIILSLFKTMAPAFIMHFKRCQDVDVSDYFEWK